MAVDSSKLLGRDIGISKGANITAPQVKMLKITKVKLGDVANNLKDNLVLTKVRNAAENKRRQEALRKKREAELENKKKKKGKGKGIKVPGAGMLGGFINGLITVLWGVVVVKILDWWKLPAVQNFIKVIGNVGKVILKVAGWLWEGFTTIVDWGYNLYDKAMGWVKNNLSEEAVTKIQTFMSNFKDLISGFLVWKLLGEKIFKAIVKNITKAFKFVKNLIRTIWTKMRRLMGRKMRMFFKNLAKRTGNLVKNLGKNVLNKAGGFMKGIGGKILGQGGGKVGGLVSKIFGKAAKVIGPAIRGAMPAVKGFFGRIPILGPLLVGIVSLMSGEPPGQALFKSVGAALGGALGTFIPVPILGTILGEAVGVFVGDLMYHLIIKRDPEAAMKLFGDTMKGIFNAGKAVVNWIFGGGLFNLLKKGGSLLMKFGKWLVSTALPWVVDKLGSAGKFLQDWLGRGLQNFTDNFPTFDVPNVGIQDLLLPVLDFFPWYKALIDVNIPDKIGWGGATVPVPFMPEGGFSLRGMFESLPRLPEILGLVTQFIPGLSSYTKDGKLERLPQVWQLANPLYMYPAMFKALFKSGGEGKDKSAAKISPSKESSAASDVSTSASYEEGGEGTETIIPIPIPEVSKPSATGNNKTKGALPSSSSSDDSNPLLVLYMGK